SFGVISGSHSSARRHVFGCWSYLKRGTTVCGNSLRLPITRIDDAVLKTLAGDVLRPAVAMAVVDGVLEELSPQSQTQELERYHVEFQKTERAIANLADAIADAGDLEPLLERLRATRVRREELRTTIAAFERCDVRRFDRTSVEHRVRAHLDTWRSLLATKQVEDGRRLIREVLAGPLRFTPEGRTYRFEGKVAFGAMFAGMADVAPFVVAVRGFEPRSRG